jgi:hypothetical protein
MKRSSELRDPQRASPRSPRPEGRSWEARGLPGAVAAAYNRDEEMAFLLDPPAWLSSGLPFSPFSPLCGVAAPGPNRREADDACLRSS